MGSIPWNGHRFRRDSKTTLMVCQCGTLWPEQWKPNIRPGCECSLCTPCPETDHVVDWIEIAVIRGRWESADGEIPMDSVGQLTAVPDVRTLLAALDELRRDEV